MKEAEWTWWYCRVHTRDWKAMLSLPLNDCLWIWSVNSILLIMLKNWQFPRRWWTFDSYVMQPCKPLTKEKNPKCCNWVFRVSCTYSDHGHTHIRVRVQYSECCYCRVVKLVHSCVVKFACCGCCSWSWPSIKSVSYLITIVYYMFDHQLGDRKKKHGHFCSLLLIMKLHETLMKSLQTMIMKTFSSVNLLNIQ